MAENTFWLKVCIFVPASMFVLTFIEGIADVYAIRNSVGKVKFMYWKIPTKAKITTKPKYLHALLPSIPWFLPFIILLVMLTSDVGSTVARFAVFFAASLIAVGASSLIYQCPNQIPVAFTSMYLLVLTFAAPLWEFTLNVINRAGFGTFLTVLGPSWIILVVGMVAYLASIERFRNYGERLQPYAFLIILGNILGMIMAIQWIIMPYLSATE